MLKVFVKAKMKVAKLTFESLSLLNIQFTNQGIFGALFRL
jgi:hypothetical protein